MIEVQGCQLLQLGLILVAIGLNHILQELLHLWDVIDEYLDVAHAFFDKKDAKFVNGLLDAVAKDVRPR